MFERLSAYTDSFLNLGIPGYDCIIYRDGLKIYRRFRGYSDRERGILMNGKERYRLYSCSKPVTCIAALQLYEKGLFGLEDDLADYMPEFGQMYVRQSLGGSGRSLTRPAKKRIRIRDLFCMTAGLSYGPYECIRDVEETRERCGTRELVRRLAGEPLLFEPGERWEYSYCHDVLAALVEVISKERFSQYVEKHIFKPLSMERSTFCLPAEEEDTLAQQYHYSKEAGEAKVCGRKMHGDLGSEYESGGGGLVSTVEDYIRFLEALRTGRILKKETVDLMCANQLTREQLRGFWLERYGYGLGVRCPIENSDVTDFGWDGLAGSYLAVDRAHGISVFYAQHVVESPVSSYSGDIIRYVLEELNQA